MKQDVVFCLTAGHYSLSNPARGAQIGAYQRAAARAFNIHIEIAKRLLDEEAMIRCTPEQFGLFIVYRIEEGLVNNRVSSLNPKLVPVTPQEIHDVTGRRSA